MSGGQGSRLITTLMIDLSTSHNTYHTSALIVFILIDQVTSQAIDITIDFCGASSNVIGRP
jgi:hypothetical protein